MSSSASCWSTADGAILLVATAAAAAVVVQTSWGVGWQRGIRGVMGFCGWRQQIQVSWGSKSSLFLGLAPRNLKCPDGEGGGCSI